MPSKITKFWLTLLANHPPAFVKASLVLFIHQGWSQSDLARACEKDRQAIEKIENGKVNPTVYSLYEITVGLRVSLKELFDF